MGRSSKKRNAKVNFYSSRHLKNLHNGEQHIEADAKSVDMLNAIEDFEMEVGKS